MSEPFERLREARKRAGYDTAAQAAAAIGVREPTYAHHENGTRGLSRSAARYAAFFRVPLDWLLEGKTPRPMPGRQTIELIGKVGAGAQLYGLDGDTAGHHIELIDAIAPASVNAVEVEGDSQYPRYLSGEILLVSKEPRPPADLIGEYAMIHCADGRQLVKIIRRPAGSSLFWLESHNAPLEDNVDIVRAYPILGTITRRRTARRP